MGSKGSFRLASCIAAALALIVLCSVSCNSGNALPQGEAAATPVAAFAGMPGLDDLPRTAAEMTGVKYWGREFDAALPNNFVLPNGESADYSPFGMSNLADFAFAFYVYDLTAETGPMTLSLDWATPPAIDEEHPLLMLGVSNYEFYCWEWFSPTDPAQLTLPEIESYRNPESGLTYVIVMVRGYAPATLNEIGWPTAFVPDPIDIKMISPHGGAPGSEVLFDIDVAEYWTLDFEWTFGGGCTVFNGDKRRPTVTFGSEEGIYDCSVRAYNEYTEDIFDFTIAIGENLWWGAGRFGRDPYPYHSEYIYLTGEHSMVVRTDTDGYLYLDNLPNGDYTLAPEKEEHTPEHIAFTVDNGYATSLDFHWWDGVTTEFGISGSVLREDGYEAGGVIVHAVGPVTRQGRMNFSYGVSGLINGMYRVTPSDEELTGDFYFKPEYRDIEIANHHVFGQYFYMSSNPIPTYTVSGTVTDLESGLPLKGITVMLTQMYIEYTKTDENGYYEFTDLPDISSASLRYNVEPLTQNAPVEFEPLRRTVWDINDADNQDFTMQPADD